MVTHIGTAADAYYHVEREQTANKYLSIALDDGKLVTDCSDDSFGTSKLHVTQLSYVTWPTLCNETRSNCQPIKSEAYRAVQPQSEQHKKEDNGPERGAG